MPITRSGAAQPAALPEADSGVTQPVAILCEANNGKGVSSLHLSELNTRSAKLGCWDVGIFQPKIDEWSWKDKNTQQTKQSAAFRCLLVSRIKPSDYVVAQQTMRNGNRRPLEQASSRFKETRVSHDQCSISGQCTARVSAHSSQVRCSDTRIKI